ncbi:MAG: hypothetical protein EOO43_23285 [Flavobacterium sp.]|nr:MAG: hypothetical protein EOO43_23285 [Flavobacterium sp.]
MKKIFLTINLAIASYCSCAQNNTFPPNGNVGIGTMTPQALLSVKGSALPGSQWAGYTSSLQVGEFMIQDYNIVPQVGISQNSYYDGTSSKYIHNGYATGMYMGANGNITFSLFNSGVSGNALSGTGVAMIIANNGNVGIGTTDTKGYRLAINGTAIAESLTIKLNGTWPDYVFQPNYKLRSLIDVKDYVDKNFHLPDMPSENDLLKNGIDLGEIVKLQTKKIEELTLYAIDQQKQIEELKKQQVARLSELEAAVYKLTKNSGK